MNNSELQVRTGQLQNTKNEHELGMPIGSILLSDKLPIIICSFCQPLKEFNELLYYLNHLRSSHGYTGNCEILRILDSDFNVEFQEDQKTSLKGSPKNLLPEYGEEYVKITADERNYNNLPSKFPEHNQCNTFIDSNAPIFNSDKNGNQSFSAVKKESEHFFCTKCRTNFLLDNELSEHICCDSFPIINSVPVRKEINQHKNNDEEFSLGVNVQSKQFCCGDCKTNFLDKNELLEHICNSDILKSERSVQTASTTCSKKQVFNCVICAATLSSKRNLDVHLKRHSGERTHVCQYCPKSFYIENDLKKHMVKHTKDRDYKCEHCDQTFGTSGTLWRHRKRSHPHLQMKRIQTNISHCNKCDANFKMKNGILDHICTNIAREIKPFSCTFCESSFISKGYLKIHMRIHTGEKPFKCKFCSLAFHRGSYLKDHMISHTQERFKCDYKNCKRSYATMWGLTSHQRRYHINRKSIQCSQCEESFQLSRELSLHLATKHGCSTCSTKFNSSKKFKKHLLKCQNINK